MKQAAPQGNPLSAQELNQDLDDLSVAELHAYIHTLRHFIDRLQDYNSSLYTELTELQQSEFLAVVNRA